MPHIADSTSSASTNRCHARQHLPPVLHSNDSTQSPLPSGARFCITKPKSTIHPHQRAISFCLSPCRNGEAGPRRFVCFVSLTLILLFINLFHLPQKRGEMGNKDRHFIRYHQINSGKSSYFLDFFLCLCLHEHKNNGFRSSIPHTESVSFPLLFTISPYFITIFFPLMTYTPGAILSRLVPTYLPSIE